ncbi:hypothetical protein BWK63_13195 [Flavobacterium covae]|uniref:hypothetical protein n=1 Tax=Flavobacterium TaxID=237 RepID=UPI000B4D74FA|nr:MULTISPECIES: hypothetical protein [Flavobacterium]OWP80024.1 hypothetical protein BWK63_13195 [Flavobacterium covae]OWP85758.1 hypothetical protein BWK60_12420 [Flavobacterium covae]POR20554.1 hypothetical protein BWK57_13155 [Flavobacterium columnare]
MQGNKAIEIHTTSVAVIDLKIKANNIEEILNAIRQELEKHPHLYLFQGHFSGFVKGEPIVSFEENQEPPNGVFQ